MPRLRPAPHGHTAYVSGISIGGPSVSAGGQVQYIQSEANFAQQLVDFLEDKRVIIDPVELDWVGAYESAQSVRAMATAMASRFPSGDMRRCVKNISSSARCFINAYDTMRKASRANGSSDNFTPSQQQETELEIYRNIFAENVFESVYVLVQNYRLDCDWDYSNFAPSGVSQVLDRMTEADI